MCPAIDSHRRRDVIDDRRGHDRAVAAPARGEHCAFSDGIIDQASDALAALTSEPSTTLPLAGIAIVYQSHPMGTSSSCNRHSVPHDDVGRTLADHDSWGVCVGAVNLWHDGRVTDPKAVKALHCQFR